MFRVVKCEGRGGETTTIESWSDVAAIIAEAAELDTEFAAIEVIEEIEEGDEAILTVAITEQLWYEIHIDNSREQRLVDIIEDISDLDVSSI